LFVIGHDFCLAAADSQAPNTEEVQGLVARIRSARASADQAIAAPAILGRGLLCTVGFR
jgi:hypothetical protein